MCLIVFALGATARWPLVLAANRDERHERPTLPAAWWPGERNVFGGRDLVAGGSWLAVDRVGRIAAVTNLPEPPRTAARSRGALVARYVGGTHTLDSSLEEVAAERDAYGPFNLVLFDRGAAAYCSNRAPAARLPSGVHAVGNAPLGTDWPKLATARDGMRAALAALDPVPALLDLLAQRTDDASFEARYRKSLFMAGPLYGTRSSTVIVLDADGRLEFVERSFDAAGRTIGETRERLVIERAAAANGSTAE